MANIRLLSTSMVQATNYNKVTAERIELTHCDLRLLLIGAIQKGLLFHKPKSSDDQNLLIQHLKTSLSRTLDIFTPLAGRLATVEHDDNSVSFFIDCNNAGAQFVHATADGVTLADILEPVYVPPIVQSFFPLKGALNYEAVSRPLLEVQVTELVNGIFIGCSMNHLVGDGTSFWNFFNSWSEIHRGSDHIAEPPVLDRRSLLDTSTCLPVRLPLTVIKNNSGTYTPPQLQERIFHFTKEKIAKLKAKANAEFGSASSISSLQSLLAHVWKSTTRNGQVIDLDREIGLIVVVGLRTRLQPPLAGTYFGNAVLGEAVTLKTRDILEHGLGYVASQINKLVSSYTEDKIKSILESLKENLKPRTIGEAARNHCLLPSSSPRFNVYGPDFGWGRPVAARSGPSNKLDGTITLFPGSDDGSVDIEVCISPEILKAMENDLEFMDAVTI